MSLVQLFCLPWYFLSMGTNFNVFTFYVTLSLVQVQSYNLNREHYRRKVALEIRNKKGKLGTKIKELGTYISSVGTISNYRKIKQK